MQEKMYLLKFCMKQDIVENENHLLNECDLYAITRRITLQKLYPELSIYNNSTKILTHPHVTSSCNTINPNRVTLNLPHDHTYDNKGGNAHFYQTLSRFITHYNLI